MANSDGSVVIEIAGDDSKFKQALNGLGSVAKGAIGGVTAAIGAVTTAVTGVAAASIKVGSDFEAAMSQVAATSGWTVADLNDKNSQASQSFELLRQMALDMGSATSFSATEAAQGLNVLAMAGLDAGESVAAIPDVLNLAAAGALSLESAASYTVGAVKGFGDSMDNAQYYADLMAKGATLANTSVAGLGEAFSGSAATANSYGQTAESVALSLLRLAEQNITGAEASTALNRAMADLYTPTSSAKKALDELGISAYDVTTGAARDFNDIVYDLSAALSGMSAEERNAAANTIFTTYGLQAFNKMAISGTEAVGKFKTGLADAFGSAAQQAATQLNNLQGDLTLLKSALEGLGVSLYSEMQEPLRAAAQTAAECVGQMAAALKADGLAGLAQEAGTVLANVLTQIAAQLPQFISMGVQVIQSLLQGLISNKDSLAASAIEIGAALISGILSVLGDVMAAGAELLLALAQGVADRAPELLEQGAAAVGNLVQGVIDGAPDFFAQAAEIVRGFAESLSNSLPELIPAAVRMIGELVEAVTSNLDQVIDAGIQLALAIAEGLIAAIPDLIATIPQIVINIADIINNNAPKLLIAGAELIAQLALGLIRAIPTLIANIPKIIEAIVKAFTAFQWLNIGKSIITALGDGLKSGVSALASAGKNIVDSIQKSFDNLPSTLANIGKNALNSIRTAISGMPKSLSQIAKSALDSIKNALTGLPSTLATIGRNALSSMQSAISSLPQTLSALAKNAAEGFLSNIKSLPSLAKSAMQSLGSNIISAIKNLPTQVIEIGKNIVKGLITGIASGAADAINAVVDLAKKMIDSAKNALGIKSPSKVFAKEVGAWLPPGIGEGIEQAMPELDDDMRRQLQDLVDDANLSVAAEVGNVSGQLALSAAGTSGSGDEPKSITNENGVVVNVYYSGTSDPQDVKKISRQIGIETAKELRRRGGT